MKHKAIPQIRHGSTADAAMLADLGARTFSQTFAAENTPGDMAAYLSSAFSPAIQSRELADPETTFLIAEIGDIAAGYAKLQMNTAPTCVTGANPVELCRLYVSDELIGHGVGAALMETCIREAGSAGYKTMWLGVWEHNERAQQFYVRWGFRRVGYHSFVLGSDEQTDWIMEREV